MQVIKALAVLPLVLLLSQCDQIKPKAAGPSPYAFDLTVEVTPAASELMRAQKSHLIAGAYYFGRALPEARAQADAFGRIKLGYEQVGLGHDATKVHLTAADFDTSKLSAVNGDPQVRVTVQSANEVGAQDDLIRCKSYFGIIKTAQAQTPVVACDVNRP